MAIWLEAAASRRYAVGMKDARSRPTLRDMERARAMFLTQAEREQISRRWQEENREAIDGYNAWIAEHGLPLAKYRMF